MGSNLAYSKLQEDEIWSGCGETIYARVSKLGSTLCYLATGYACRILTFEGISLCVFSSPNGPNRLSRLLSCNYALLKMKFIGCCLTFSWPDRDQESSITAAMRIISPSMKP